MASNSFGTLFKVTTWGESHGKAIGLVIDGCPAGLALNENDIQEVLALRTPGRKHTSPRMENDKAEIYSGVFEGKTTGTPISIIIFNQDARSEAYEPMKNILRPGHANFTYLEKYGLFDYRGGGRASARETACRVAAGAVAKKLLRHFSIETCAYLSAVGEIKSCVEPKNVQDTQELREFTLKSPIFCPDEQATEKIIHKIDVLKKAGDSVGGIVTFFASNVPTGLGEPIYEKLEANLAKMMLSINAAKAFEIGEGFESASMTGSEHNDSFVNSGEKIVTQTNHAGGVLAGISNGMPIYGRVAFKPASSIQKSQETTDTKGHSITFQLPEGSRHDPCVAIRAVPVVDAMCALVLADALLMNRCACI